MTNLGSKKLSSGLHFLYVFLIYLFLYLPIAILIIFSFNSKPFPGAWDSFTTIWYEKLFNSASLWISFKNSLIVATLSTFLSLSMGILLMFYRASGGGIKRFIPLFYGNMIIPETVLAVSLLTFFTLFHIPLGLPTVVISHAVLGLGFTIPILYTRYSELDPKIFEASLILGASPIQTFFKVTLPLLKPTIFSTGLLIFILSFDDFIIAYFSSGTSFQTLSIYLFSTIRAGISPVVNALSTLLLVLTSCLVTLFFSPKLKARTFG